MATQTHNTSFPGSRKVDNLETGHKITLPFETVIPFGDHDDLENQIEKIGQEFKRTLYLHTLQAADRRVAELARAVTRT